MAIYRRWILGLVAAPALLRVAEAGQAGPTLAQMTSPRSVGRPDAKYKVTEFFSLTCTHCAAFQREIFPKVKTDWIDTGNLLLTYHDFPLDKVALQAAMVARALPPDRYEPFITTLFASQDRWAFARGINPTNEIQKLALLAGRPADTFQATIANEQLKQFIIDEEQQAERDWKVDATPTFLANGKTHSGEMGYDSFVRFVTAAGG